jgi:Family of unknown function (DUF6788)
MTARRRLTTASHTGPESGQTACLVRARPDGGPQGFTVTQGQAGTSPTCISADQHPCTRHARCGKPRCACAADPPSLHGPYIQWTRTVHGKTVTRLLTPAQYQAYAPWFANTRRLRALAAELETLSLAEMASAEGWERSPPAPRHRPAPAPSAALTRTTPNHPKRREISPLNPGTALRGTSITAGHQSSVVGLQGFRRRSDVIFEASA